LVYNIVIEIRKKLGVYLFLENNVSLLDLHSFAKVPREYIIARVLYYSCLVGVTLLLFIILLIIRSKTKSEDYVVKDGEEKFLRSSPDVSCHVYFSVINIK
jgi:hypothetical protein